jgi:hypothetical protein
LIALALACAPVYAATTKPVTKPRPTPTAPPRKPLLPQPPEIYQINPTKVNPTVEPNIMIVGQALTPATTVQVGGRQATTVQAPDQNHLLVKLPDNLGHGSYTIEVTNEAGTAVASDPLVVDDGTGQLSTLQIVAVVGFLIFLVLVLRMARTPGLA